VGGGDFEGIPGGRAKTTVCCVTNVAGFVWDMELYMLIVELGLNVLYIDLGKKEKKKQRGGQ
jgi:hypothetical protein